MLASPYRVVPAGMKRMTSRQTPQSHPHPFGRAVSLDSFTHIVRTGRVKAARRGQPGGHTKLIYADGPRYDPLQRRNRRSTSRCSSCVEASNALRRGLMTMDHWGFNRSRWKRTASRTRRLIRLRTTAFPRARGVVNPMCGPSGSVSRTQKAANRDPEKRVPWS
jgi:hypothetical protein